MSNPDLIESRQKMEDILKQEVIGYLGLLDNGRPYVVPLNYGYIAGRVLFHGSLTGKKMDCLRANPHVCFTVARQSGQVRRHGDGEPCHVDSDSVICYGTARVIEEPEERRAALDKFNRCFRPNATEISLDRALGAAVVEITISEMTGRQERERKRVYWRCTFQQ